MTEQQPRLFQIWLDASDGSIATYDGVQWPDGTADVHHRYRRPDGVQWSPQALAKTIHGKQARIEWTPDPAADLAARVEAAEAQVARVRNFLEDMAGWCSPHGIAADYARRGLDALDGVDPLGLAGPTREQLAEPAEWAEQDCRVESTGSGCIARSLRCKVHDPAPKMPSSADLAESLGSAMAAMQPGAEPVFCHHENARRSVHETMQAGWGRQTVVALECPTCNAKAASAYGEPVLAPYLLNAARCTQACTEQHTLRPGCLMAPDWSKPIPQEQP